MLSKKYSKKVMENFKNPKNKGSMKNPDAVGTVTSPVCGDITKVYLKIKNDKIKDIKFETFGCIAAVATASMMTQMVKGKSLKEARKISGKAVTEILGGLPKPKVHCTTLTANALKVAIDNYYKKHPKSKKK